MHDLRSVNNLKSDELKLGQTLTIPANDAASTHRALH